MFGGHKVTRVDKSAGVKENMKLSGLRDIVSKLFENVPKDIDPEIFLHIYDSGDNMNGSVQDVKICRTRIEHTFVDDKSEIQIFIDLSKRS